MGGDHALYFVGAVNSGDGNAKPPAFVYAIVPNKPEIRV